MKHYVTVVVNVVINVQWIYNTVPVDTISNDQYNKV